ncbi:hypothetical protein BJM39_24465 [Salmonella enterica subsp. enterica serovar Javiana]|nr:hypothetical protein BJM39_24465 [Salmonella enterica subsp. enterica serovar Javiana]
MVDRTPDDLHHAGDQAGPAGAASAGPPKLRQQAPAAAEDVEPTQPASLASTDFSSQDGPTDQAAQDAPQTELAEAAGDGGGLANQNGHGSGADVDSQPGWGSVSQPVAAGASGDAVH